MLRCGIIMVAVAMLGGCGPRVIVATGTTIGIRATPGDGQTRPPQFVIGYKRAETSLIPVEGGGAEKTGNDVTKDAASTVASFYLKSQWTDTEIRSFVGTGFAARNIVGDSEAFAKAFAAATAALPPEPIRERQRKLLSQWSALNQDEAKAQRILDLAGYDKKTNVSAVDSLQQYIASADTPPKLQTLESAFNRAVNP